MKMLRKSILTGIVFLFTLQGNCALAQTLSDQEEAQIIQRVTVFLRDVARLSPLPAGTDADRGQFLPGNPTRSTSYSGTSKTVLTPRGRDVIVRTVPESRIEKGNGYNWEVNFYDAEITVSIQLPSGKVTGIHDTILEKVLRNDPAPPVEKCISRETAIVRAIAYLKKTGLNLQEFALNHSALMDSTIPVNASSRTWYMSFRRIWQGVPVSTADQYITVELDAGKGRLKKFDSSAMGPLPVNVRLNVSREDAIAKARQFIAERSLGDILEDLRVEICVRMPNNYWEKTAQQVQPTRAPFSRLVWELEFLVHDRVYNTDDQVTFWIDTTTGEVCGGEISGVGTRTYEVPSRPLLRQFQKAQALEVRPLNRGKAGTRVMQKQATEGLAFWGLLSGIYLTSGVLQSAPFAPTHELTLTLPDKTRVVCLYDADTGFITRKEQGAKGERLLVGAALREWITPLLSRKKKT